VKALAQSDIINNLNADALATAPICVEAGLVTAL